MESKPTPLMIKKAVSAIGSQGGLPLSPDWMMRRSCPGEAVQRRQ